MGGRGGTELCRPRYPPLRHSLARSACLSRHTTTHTTTRSLLSFGKVFKGFGPMSYGGVSGYWRDMYDGWAKALGFLAKVPGVMPLGFKPPMPFGL